VGVISVGHFRKRITDFLVTGRGGIGVVSTGPDNGFGGDYAGYTLLSRSNGGLADVTGWEFNYQQQLSFLPGWAKGFSVFANYTILDTKGDYGSDAERSTDSVAGFVPEAANFGFTYKNRAWNVRLVGNHTGGYLATYDADPARLRFRDGRTLYNIGISYQVRPWLEFSADIVNILNKPQRFYRGSEERLQTWTVNGTSLTLGVSGRF
jgi:outer membrane receptor protein involved in Fe transport